VNGTEHRTAGHATAAAWAVLVAMGGTEMTFNVYHSVHSGSLDLALALLVGIAPVFAAMCLSHIVAEGDSGTGMKALTFLVMLGAMGLSIGAVSAVIKPVTGEAMSWLFGLVLDAAALLALRTILSARSKRMTEATALESAEVRAREAASEAGGLRRELAALRSDTAVAATESAAAKAVLEADLIRSRAQLEAVREAGPAGRSQRSAKAGPKRSSDRSRTAPRTGAGTAGPDDVDLEARALQLLAADLTMTGADLARELDISPGYGRKLRRRLTGEDVAVQSGDDGRDED